jgi:uncharacterized protein (DUF302 family)
MKYIVESNKSIDQLASDLETAVKNHQFGVLHVHDLHATLNKKGIPFQNACRIFEVCNPKKAHDVLMHDMSLNMALPCRVSIWEDNNTTHIGMISPKAALSMLSDDKALVAMAEEVEMVMQQIINEAK